MYCVSTPLLLAVVVCAVGVSLPTILAGNVGEPDISIYLEDDYDTPFYHTNTTSFPTDDEEVNAVRDAMDHAHRIMLNMFGIDSYDGIGSPYVAARENGNVKCRFRRRWMTDPVPGTHLSEEYVAYSEGTGQYDFVAEQYGIAYGVFMDNLHYAYDTGSIRSSFAQIFAETIQLLNNYNDENYDKRNDGNCPTQDDDSHRWVIGDMADPDVINLPENTQGFEEGTFDAWNPHCLYDFEATLAAAKISEMACAPWDNGAVEANVGVASKTYTLVVDGGTFNGETVTGIGLIKAFTIWVNAKIDCQTESSTFQHHASCLAAACEALIDAELLDENGDVYNGTISSQDCIQVDTAIAATEMAKKKPCHKDHIDYRVYWHFPRAVPSRGGVVYLITAGGGAATNYKTDLAAQEFQTATFTNAGLFYPDLDKDVWNRMEQIYLKPLEAGTVVQLNVSSNSDRTEWITADKIFDRPFQIEYFDDPSLTSVVPSSGKLVGGNVVTIKGSGFKEFTGCGLDSYTEGIRDIKDCLRCRFGSTYFTVPAIMIDEHTVECIAPAHEAGTVIVSIALIDPNDAFSPLLAADTYYANNPSVTYEYTDEEPEDKSYTKSFKWSYVLVPAVCIGAAALILVVFRHFQKASARRQNIEQFVNAEGGDLGDDDNTFEYEPPTEATDLPTAHDYQQDADDDSDGNDDVNVHQNLMV